jgi:hypothetical protein
MITEPVAIREPICESNRCTVFKNPSVPVFYRVEAKCPDGTTKVLDNVRAYTKSLTVDDKHGRIELEIESENPAVSPKLCRVGYPYHYIHAGRVLCVLKNFNLRNASEPGYRSFGLNYNLFELPWELCVVLHKPSDGLLAFVTSRMEWDRGTLSMDNREVQMFIKVPDERHVPVSLMKLLVDPSIAMWMACCEAESVKKGT